MLCFCLSFVSSIVYSCIYGAQYLELLPTRASEQGKYDQLGLCIYMCVNKICNANMLLLCIARIYSILKHGLSRALDQHANGASLSKLTE